MTAPNPAAGTGVFDAIAVLTLALENKIEEASHFVASLPTEQVHDLVGALVGMQLGSALIVCQGDRDRVRELLRRSALKYAQARP